MKKIIFSQKQESSIIHISDVLEDVRKIYCYEYNGRLVFLRKGEVKYRWHELDLSTDYWAEYDTFNEALHGAKNYSIMIFDSQSEVFEYTKTELKKGNT